MGVSYIFYCSWLGESSLTSSSTFDTRRGSLSSSSSLLSPSPPASYYNNVLRLKPPRADVDGSPTVSAANNERGSSGNGRGGGKSPPSISSRSSPRCLQRLLSSLTTAPTARVPHCQQSQLQLHSSTHTPPHIPTAFSVPTNASLMKEYHDLTADPINDTLTAGPVSEDNMLEWEALIQGPEETPYVSCHQCREVTRLGGGREAPCKPARG